MSTAPASTAVTNDRRQIVVIGHSMLFYWWPVWAFGFVAALWTLVEGHRIAILPANVRVSEVVPDKKYELTIESGSPTLALREAVENSNHPEDRLKSFKPRVSQFPFLGGAFVVILLLVIVITSIPLRGMVAIVTVATIVILLLLVMLFGVLDNVLQATLGSLNVYINLSGYLVLSSVLFAIWLFTVNVFDQSQYIIFTPGQMRVRLEIGDGETSFDVIGMSIEKKRDDPFRHWVLGFAWWPGFGTGDLVVKTSGANAKEFHLPNVIAIDTKLRQIQEMQRDRPIVSG